MQIRRDRENALQDREEDPPGEDAGEAELTPTLLAELLEPESWSKMLNLYARTMKLTVALIDTSGHLVGTCHNPQPIWLLVHGANPELAGACPLCLESHPRCTAATDARQTNSLTLVQDQAGFAHVALPLSLNGRHLGTLLAGQIFDRYPEPLPLQRVSREFGLAPQQLWNLARQQVPMSRANLLTYGELLWTLGQTFLRERYRASRERSWTERTNALNHELAAVNSALHHKVSELDLAYGDLQKAEQSAEQAKIYAEHVIATVPDPLLVLDDTLRVRSANEAFYKIFRVNENETEGQLVYELGNGQWDIPELRRLLSELLPRDLWVQNFQMEHDFAHIGRKTMVLNARRIDHLELILLAVQDITILKQSERSLQKINSDLKNFSYAASHDLQEPLRMVKTSAQWLARTYKGRFDPQADEFISEALEGANRLETLLRDLREYWLATEGISHRVPIDCALVVRKTIKALQIAIQESGSIVTYDPLPTLVADEVSLAMLFQNLIGNAIKYRRPDQPPRIHVSAQRVADTWSFLVKDNGIGIEKKYLEAIFAPFKRLHGKNYPGSGIGLALCQKIVERYGGRLWVESVYGQGSTFAFTICETAGDKLKTFHTVS